MEAERNSESRISTIRLSDNLRRQLQAVAERDNVSVSSAMRRLISIGLRVERRSSELSE
jgi:predicted transcriptional regulator